MEELEMMLVFPSLGDLAKYNALYQGRDMEECQVFSRSQRVKFWTFRLDMLASDDTQVMSFVHQLHILISIVHFWQRTENWIF